MSSFNIAYYIFWSDMDVDNDSNDVGAQSHLRHHNYRKQCL